MALTRINARLSQPLAEFVQHMVGPEGRYETPSEYVRDLIRRDSSSAPLIPYMGTVLRAASYVA